MYLTGFADEAGVDIETQIKVTKALGWKYIEARKVAVGNYPAAMIHDIPDEAFELIAQKLEENGLAINCFGSAIANWGKKIDESFQSSLDEAERSIKRMKRIGTKLIRVMSFAVREADDQMEEERFRRLRQLQKMFSDNGLTMVHENCMNYGGMGWTFTLKLIENVPGLKLVFDTGNPVFSDDRTKPKPYPKQSSWEFYSNVKEYVAYVHIKDGKWDAENKKCIYTFPGEGDGDVVRIVEDLIARGYDGGFSIEPHLGTVFHDPKSGTTKNAEEIYIEYGKRMMRIVENAKAKIESTKKKI